MIIVKSQNLILYIFLVILSVIISILFNHLVLTKDAYYFTFENQLGYSTIDQIFTLQEKYKWIRFSVIPLVLFVKITLISLCLQTGLILNNTKLSFRETFKIALSSEFVFLLPELLKIVWFTLFKINYTLNDVQQFYPFSALNLFKIENISKLLIYPFQVFNIFEVFYWILLAGGIKQALGTNVNHGIQIVFSGYIPALMLWIIFMMFMIVSFSTVA